MQTQHEGGKWWPKPAVAKPPFTLSCFCYLTRKYYSIESSLFTFWSDRRVEIGMATSWLQAVGRLRLPLWGAAHQTSQFGLAKVLVKVDHSCGCERCGRVTGLLSIHWLFLQMVEELFSLLPSLVPSLCDWRSFLIGRWGMLSLSWLKCAGFWTIAQSRRSWLEKSNVDLTGWTSKAARLSFFLPTSWSKWWRRGIFPTIKIGTFFPT